MRVFLRILAVVFAAGSAMGLVTRVVAMSPDLTMVAAGWPFWWPALGLPLGLLFLWLSARQGERDRLVNAVPRRLAGAKREAFSSALRGHSPHAIIASIGDGEADIFATDLLIAIGNAGWHPALGTHEDPTEKARIANIRVEVSETATADERAAAVRLRYCLKAYGFRVGRLRTMPRRATIKVLNAIVLAPITLTVGGRV